MNNPILSICIPTYNRASCLKDCLNSIVSQFKDNDVYEQIEVAISDNASTDDTLGVVKEFQEKFNNIRYYRNIKNLGFDRNLLNAVEKSSGEYCLTIGDDDAFFPGSLSLIINKIKTIGASYFMLNCWGYDHWLNKPVVSHPNQQISKDVIYNNLSDFVKSKKSYHNLVGLFCSMSTQLFSRKIWMNFDKKENYIGTNTVHFYILLTAFKNSKFTLLADPIIKTRNDNLRWDSYVGLETNFKRSMSTAKAIFWISSLYDLPISRYKIKIYFFVRGYWLALKELIKRILRKIRLRK